MASSPSGSEITLSSSTLPRRKSTNLPITSIPDMRFEQSYLASVRGFLHEYSPSSAEEKKKEEREDDGKGGRGKAPDIMTSNSPTGEPEIWLGRLQIQWWPLLHLTIRDQILSPILQGAVFGFGGLALGQLRAYLVARGRKTKQ